MNKKLFGLFELVENSDSSIGYTLVDFEYADDFRSAASAFVLYFRDFDLFLFEPIEFKDNFCTFWVRNEFDDVFVFKVFLMHFDV